MAVGNVKLEGVRDDTLCGFKYFIRTFGMYGNGLEGEKARGGGKEGGVLAHRYIELQHMGNESRLSNMLDEHKPVQK